LGDCRLHEAAKRVLRSVGMDPGQTCVDFGCGHGNYTIPLARIVGPAGTVHALDKDGGKLNELLRRADGAGLGNIRRMDSPGDSRIALDDGSVDVILLYDVLHSHYFCAEERDALFREVARVSSPEAVMSVFPNHMEQDEIEAEIIGRAAGIGFDVASEYRGPVVHDDGITEGYILTFRRGGRDL